MSNVIQFPVTPNELTADDEVYDRIVLREPTPPSAAANAAVFLAGFAVMFMVVTVLLS